MSPSPVTEDVDRTPEAMLVPAMLLEGCCCCWLSRAFGIVIGWVDGICPSAAVGTLFLLVFCCLDADVFVVDPAVVVVFAP